jgi:hypothetical protein
MFKWRWRYERIRAGKHAAMGVKVTGSALSSVDLRPELPLILRNAGAASVTDEVRGGF